ncbi:AAA family ATPase [Hymenobacter endophyticus]|uniref:AAA family ATPase n=1 Tax=Hymenobacter endophyticus TaxID=3076335 RepID=A0ABU3TNX9_9BACT|nr:AAA family ATPase [Hymenobacter endophyticus]MDU0372900.1 AAA family ATPase [Hymenobacter endophyticus]
MSYDLISFMQSVQENSLPQAEPSLIFDLAADEIRINSNIPDLIPVVRIAGEVIAVQGDISFIAGKPKAGKTAVCTFIAASALIRNKSGIDTLTIHTNYAYGREVILVDTEQPKANTLKQVKNICKVLDVVEQPPNLHVFNFREDNKATKLKKVEKLFEEYPKAHLWIIDGLADLIEVV